MSLEGKKVAVLVEDLYHVLELWVPTYRLREEGADVTIVGPEAGGTYKSKDGYPAKAEVAVDDVRGADFDAVVIPGGYAPDRMRRIPAMVDMVREAYEAGKIVAFICHAGWLPITAGILEGKTATCYFSIKDDMLNAGVNYVDEPIVRDGNLISSRKPDDLPHFGRAIVEALSE
jgi:protease I